MTNPDNQSISSITKKQYRPIHQNISQSASYAQVKSSTKLSENITPETEPINSDQSTKFQKMFDFIQLVEKMLEPYRVNSSALSDTAI